MEEMLKAEEKRQRALDQQVLDEVFGGTDGYTRFRCPYCQDSRGYFRTISDPRVEPRMVECKECGWSGLNSEHDCFPPSAYSEDMTQAMRVVERMAKRGWSFAFWSVSKISSVPGPVAAFRKSVYPPERTPYMKTGLPIGAPDDTHYAWAKTPAEAICEAAILAITMEGIEQERQEREKHERAASGDRADD